MKTKEKKRLRCVFFSFSRPAVFGSVAGSVVFSSAPSVLTPFFAHWTVLHYGTACRSFVSVFRSCFVFLFCFCAVFSAPTVDEPFCAGKRRNLPVVFNTASDDGTAAARRRTSSSSCHGPPAAACSRLMSSFDPGDTCEGKPTKNNPLANRIPLPPPPPPPPRPPPPPPPPPPCRLRVKCLILMWASRWTNASIESEMKYSWRSPWCRSHVLRGEKKEE